MTENTKSPIDVKNIGIDDKGSAYTSIPSVQK
jgi:hypothetical protein